MPKSPPPARAVTLPPPWFRAYGHVRAFDAACPACGAVASISTATGRVSTTPRGARSAKYEDLTSTWTCRRCARQWYVGVLLVAVGRSTGGARPADHIPTVEEAAQLRLDLAWASTRPARAKDPINRVCVCEAGQVCPLHEDDETVAGAVVAPRGDTRG